MVEESAAPRPKVVLYPGSYHGFDSESPARYAATCLTESIRGKAFMWEAMRTREDCHANALLEFVQQLNEK